MPHCVAQMQQPPTAYTIEREDAGAAATFVPGVELLLPGQPLNYGTAAPDPQVIVTNNQSCGNACFYTFVYRFNALSASGSLSGNPNAKFPAGGFEGFTHAIRAEDADPDLRPRAGAHSIESAGPGTTRG
jgi:hypothetical protein